MTEPFPAGLSPEQAQLLFQIRGLENAINSLAGQIHEQGCRYEHLQAEHEQLAAACDALAAAYDEAIRDNIRLTARLEEIKQMYEAKQQQYEELRAKYEKLCAETGSNEQ